MLFKVYMYCIWVSYIFFLVSFICDYVRLRCVMMRKGRQCWSTCCYGIIFITTCTIRQTSWYPSHHFHRMLIITSGLDIFSILVSAKNDVIMLYCKVHWLNVLLLIVGINFSELLISTNIYYFKIPSKLTHTNLVPTSNVDLIMMATLWYRKD